MVTRFPSKQDPLFSLLDIYSRQEKYNDVISTLNRLEKRWVRMSSCLWRNSVFIFR